MTSLARALRGRGARAWLSIAGVAISMVLVLVLTGAFHSVRSAMASYAGQADVDLWIGPAGADNLIRGSPVPRLSAALVDSIRKIPGVAVAEPLLQWFLTVRSPGPANAQRSVTLLAIGYRVPNGLGGPPAYAVGRAPRGPHEAALDRAAAYRLRVDIGDSVVMAGRKLVVTGLTSGTNILATQFVFVDLIAAADAAGIARASWILVRLDRGASPLEVASVIEQQFADLRVHTRASFVAANDREVAAGFVPLLAFIGVLGVAAAAVLVGLLVHSVVEDRRSDIAVLLALGAEATSVGRGLIWHALSLVVAGAAVGSGLAFLTGVVLDRFFPIIPLHMAVADVLVAAGVFIAAGAVAGLVPVAQLARIDPLDAFRS